MAGIRFSVRHYICMYVWTYCANIGNTKITVKYHFLFDLGKCEAAHIFLSGCTGPVSHQWCMSGLVPSEPGQYSLAGETTA